jgi:hypothetical protein
MTVQVKSEVRLLVGYASQPWKQLLSADKQFFIILLLINVIYQSYRPFDTNTDLLQTQKCKPTWEPCQY